MVPSRNILGQLPRRSVGAERETTTITTTTIIITKMYLYGLQSIFRYSLLFDLKEASGRQNKEVIKNMDPGAGLHGFN